MARHDLAGARSVLYARQRRFRMAKSLTAHLSTSVDGPSMNEVGTTTKYGLRVSPQCLPKVRKRTADPCPMN
jgi:hypothetical protein